MGRVCRLCLRECPHEHFGGKGERAQICKRCRQLPRAERKLIMATDELMDFLSQSNISERNIRRLEESASIPDPEFQVLRALVLDIARVCPRRRKRWRIIREVALSLYRRAADAGLIEAAFESGELQWGVDDEHFGIHPETDDWPNEFDEFDHHSPTTDRD